MTAGRLKALCKGAHMVGMTETAGFDALCYVGALRDRLQQFGGRMMSFRRVGDEAPHALTINGKVVQMGGAHESRGCHSHVFGRAAALA
jgi:hypothetical protein